MNLDDEDDNRWISIIKESVYPELYPQVLELKRQAIQSIDWIGKSLLIEDQTEAFILLMIALETLVEQDPNELENKVKKEYPNLEVKCSIDEQLTSIMDLLSVEPSYKNDANRGIKRAYSLRSKIIHNGIQLNDDNGELNEMLSIWYDHLLKMITKIIFENNWKTKYDLWKEANHISNVESNGNS